MAKRIAFNESASQIKLCSGAVTLQPQGSEGDHAELTEDQVKHGTVVLMERARKISVLSADDAAARLKKSKASAKKQTEAVPKETKKETPKAAPKEPEPAPEPPPPTEPPPSTEKTEEKADAEEDDGDDDDDEKKSTSRRSKKKKSRRG